MDEPLLGEVPENGMIYRFLPAQRPETPATIMLHGLSGDENSMWVLQHALPAAGLIVAPRGVFPLSEGGFSWIDGPIQGWPTAPQFMPALGALEALFRHLQAEGNLKRERVLWMGFSQGAALAFCAANHSPMMSAGVIAAAGFLPEGEFRGLKGLPVFWGHGSLDAWIPISRAEQDTQRLREVGARVHFCQAEAGHKMGVECLQGLRLWFRTNSFVSP